MSALASLYGELGKAKSATMVVESSDLPFRRAVECCEGVHFRHVVSRRDAMGHLSCFML
jgi:hypothetical protein